MHLRSGHEVVDCRQLPVNGNAGAETVDPREQLAANSASRRARTHCSWKTTCLLVWLQPCAVHILLRLLSSYNSVPGCAYINSLCQRFTMALPNLQGTHAAWQCCGLYISRSADIFYDSTYQPDRRDGQPDDRWQLVGA
jgi:hypothetical protein